MAHATEPSMNALKSSRLKFTFQLFKAIGEVMMSKSDIGMINDVLRKLLPLVNRPDDALYKADAWIKLKTT